MSASTAEHATIRVERLIPAPAGQVYQAWLDPQLLRLWMAPGSMTMARAEVEEWPGGCYRIWQEDSGRDAGGFEAELLELVPDERLVFRWGFASPQRADGPVFDSRLTVTLRPDPAGAPYSPWSTNSSASWPRPCPRWRRTSAQAGKTCSASWPPRSPREPDRARGGRAGGSEPGGPARRR